MTTERTLSIIKPDAVRKNHIGDILSILEKGGLKVVAARLVHLTEKQAGSFYQIHSQRPFYQDLVQFMSSGPVMVLVLQGENAIAKNRALMGATDPKKALPDTIRGKFAESVDQNAVHGSDGVDTAQEEISFFFSSEEIHS